MKKLIYSIIFLLTVAAASFACAAEELPEFNNTEEFRFSVVDDAKTVLLRQGAVIKEEKSDDSRDIALSKSMTKAYVLSDEEGEDWKYVESGGARGFVRETELVSDLISEKMLSTTDPETIATATLLVRPSENKAVDYTDITATDNVVDGVKMKTTAVINVKEAQDRESKTVGIMEVGSVCYVLEDPGTGWVYIESGDVRGFVEAKALLQDASFEDDANENVAIETVPLAENAALRYSLKSTKAANSVGKIRQSMVEFALQFVGNPYVWGGESLTHGIDCSGFVKAIYSYYGISLPRVACDQAVAGKKIAISEAQPGDLIFYSNNNYVYHVSMYIGDGQVVHAANSKEGITTSGINGSACWAVDFLDA